MPEKKVPVGRLGRLSNLARVGARSGASWLWSRGGSTLAAEQAAQVLGSMRGLAAKVGQMAGYVDGFVPEAHRAVYQRALSGLQSAAPTSPAATVHALLEQELGAPPDELFAHFEPEPFASASIGQVHRAVLPDGRRVAVKVQHPGVEQAVEADLKNAAAVERMLSPFVVPSAFNSRELVEEVAARFREELDYAAEARWQARFAELHAGDPHIRIPAVVAERSSRRVLTTELVEGHGLDWAAAREPDARRHYAEVLWRFVFKGNLVAGLFNADPHPGNYLFHADGRVTFLDFGCVQPLTPHSLEHARGAHLACLAGDEAAFVEHVAQLGKAEPGAYRDAFVAYIRDCMRPVFESPHRVQASLVVELTQGMEALRKVAFQDGSGLTPLPEGTVLLNRLQFGFLSVLARLDVEADYAEVERRFLSEAGYR